MRFRGNTDLGLPRLGALHGRQWWLLTGGDHGLHRVGRELTNTLECLLAPGSDPGQGRKLGHGPGMGLALRRPLDTVGTVFRTVHRFSIAARTCLTWQPLALPRSL
ncbi:hypothetical protein GCM10009603_65980 [Nocardiopsis exhalans]